MRLKLVMRCSRIESQNRDAENRRSRTSVPPHARAPRETQLLRVDVEQRQTGVQDVVLTQLHRGDEATGGTAVAVIGQEDALWEASRAGGVEDRRRFARCPLSHLGSRTQQLFINRLLQGRSGNQCFTEMRYLGHDRGRSVFEFRLHDQERGIAMCENVPEAVSTQPGVNGHCNSAEPGDRKERRHEVSTVLEHHRHAVPAADTSDCKCRRAGVDARPELSRCPRPLICPDERIVRAGRSPIREETPEGGVSSAHRDRAAAARC